MLRYTAFTLLAIITLSSISFSFLAGMEEKKEKNQRLIELGLMDAIRNLDVEKAKKALEEGAKDISSELYVLSNLTAASGLKEDNQKKLKIAQLLIDAGANVNYGPLSGDNILDIASIHNDIELVKLLIQAGADPLLINNHSLTKNVETMQLLLEAGARPNTKSKYGTPLDYILARIALWGIDQGEETMLKQLRLLIEYGADIRLVRYQQEGRSAILHAFKDDPIMQAIALHETDQAKELLEHLYYAPIPKEETEKFKNRLEEIFLLAIAQRENEIVALLLREFKKYLSLERGLVAAARTGNLALIREFNEESRAQIPPEQLTYALTQATIRGHADVVRYLLQQDLTTMQIDLLPAIARIEGIVRYETASPVYHQIYDMLMKEAVGRPTRTLTYARHAGPEAGTNILDIPVELRQYIGSLIPTTK